MPLEFQLYMQVNPDAGHYYPYVGVSKQTSRIINISSTHMDISEAADNLFHEPDYLLTSRSFEFDLEHFDHLIHTYIGNHEYRIIVRFNKHKHATLTYHSPTNESAKDYDIFLGYPEKRAVQLIADIYPIMQKVKEFVLSTD